MTKIIGYLVSHSSKSGVVSFLKHAGYYPNDSTWTLDPKKATIFSAKESAESQMTSIRTYVYEQSNVIPDIELTPVEVTF